MCENKWACTKGPNRLFSLVFLFLRVPLLYVPCCQDNLAVKFPKPTVQLIWSINGTTFSAILYTLNDCFTSINDEIDILVRLSVHYKRRRIPSLMIVEAA